MKPCTKRPSLDLTVNSMTEPNAGKLQVDNQRIIPTLLSDTGPFHAMIALTIFLIIGQEAQESGNSSQALKRTSELISYKMSAIRFVKQY